MLIDDGIPVRRARGAQHVALVCFPAVLSCRATLKDGALAQAKPGEEWNLESGPLDCDVVLTDICAVRDLEILEVRSGLNLLYRKHRPGESPAVELFSPRVTSAGESVYVRVRHIGKSSTPACVSVYCLQKARAS